MYASCEWRKKHRSMKMTFFNFFVQLVLCLSEGFKTYFESLGAAKKLQCKF